VATLAQEDRFPLDELQRYIRDQLQHLRSELLSYDEVVADYRKEQHKNTLLTQQVDAQKEHCAQLKEQIRDHRQNESDLQSRCVQVEQELVIWKNKTRDHESNLSELEQALSNAQDQMKEVDQNLRSKTTELDDAHQRLQDLVVEITKSKVEFLRASVILLTQAGIGG
jgi:chromosome segregation ATPase